MKTLVLSVILFFTFLVKMDAQVNFVYLKSAKVIFYTPSSSELGNDNKDHDTTVEIQVQGTYGYLSTSTLYNEDREFPDNNSNNEVYLNVNTPGRPYINKDEFRLGKVTFIVRPNGHDEWIFKPTIVFTFSDGTTTSYTANNVLRVNQNQQLAAIGFGGYQF